MTANKPNVRRYDDMGCPEQICRIDTMHESDDGDYVLYEDYEALREECEKLRAENRNLKDELSDYYSQNKCGCGHPACKRCRDDRFVEEALREQAHYCEMVREGAWPAYKGECDEG